MSKIRIICVETDSGDACNIGGPAHIRHRTFEIEVPIGVAEWINEPTAKKWSFVSRSIVGVEIPTGEPSEVSNG